MAATVFANATLVLPDRLWPASRFLKLIVEGGRIEMIGAPAKYYRDLIDLGGGYLAPGFVDLHVHGGDGADFMDGTDEAFRTACRAHARHGTTSLLPTTTVASHEQHLTFLGLCRRLKADAADGARILGAHFYGPYFAYAARGAHPGAGVRPPVPAEYEPHL